ncbi:MAG TPA: hypothetical protein VKA34_20625 [Balneolales bacterium]|nr:hypothetical protein [Balneolales bacterium]
MITDPRNKKVDSKPVGVRKLTSFSHRIPVFHKVLEKIRRGNTLLIISALFQTLIGLTVVIISIIGNIHPLWLASVMSILGSITVMYGIYLWYELLRDKDDMDDLFKKAIRRVINSQN